MTLSLCKFAVQSAGFDPNADFTWVAHPSQCVDNCHVELGCIIDGNTPGVMVQKTGDRFAVLLCGLISTRYDYRDRAITAKFYVGELTEAKARGIVIAFLADEENLSARLLQTIAEDVNERGWNVDFERVAYEIERIPEAPLGRPFAVRRSNVYESSTKSVLIDELNRYTFSPSEGFKLYWGGVTNIPEDKEKLLREVDRFYSPTAKDTILANTAPPAAPPDSVEIKPKEKVPTKRNNGQSIPPRKNPDIDIEAIRRNHEESTQASNEGVVGVIKNLWKGIDNGVQKKTKGMHIWSKQSSPKNETKKEDYHRDERERIIGPGGDIY